MKTVKIGERHYSKLLCGTNSFWARSHFSDARDAEYRHRFSDQAIGKMLYRCLEFGINTVESSYSERVHKILDTVREESGRTINFIGSTRIDQTSEIKSHSRKLNFLLEMKSDICVIHAQIADRPGNGQIPGLRGMVEKIHDAGLLAGISTHLVESVRICEENSYGVDVYLFPLNETGFVYPGFEHDDTVRDRIDIIQNTPKPFIIMKALGAGRIPPDEGLRFISENVKPDDLISIGFGLEEEIDECVNLVEKYF